MDELGNRIFTINEPRWSSEEDTQRLKRLHDCYAKYEKFSS